MGRRPRQGAVGMARSRWWAAFFLQRFGDVLGDFLRMLLEKTSFGLVTFFLCTTHQIIE